MTLGECIRKPQELHVGNHDVGQPGQGAGLGTTEYVVTGEPEHEDDKAEENEDAWILRAALTLILDDALMLLEEPPPTRREETEGLGTDNTKPRIIER